MLAMCLTNFPAVDLFAMTDVHWELTANTINQLTNINVSILIVSAALLEVQARIWSFFFFFFLSFDNLVSDHDDEYMQNPSVRSTNRFTSAYSCTKT